MGKHFVRVHDLGGIKYMRIKTGDEFFLIVHNQNNRKRTPIKFDDEF